MASEEIPHAPEDILNQGHLEAVPALDEAAEKAISRESKEFDVTVGDKTVKIHVEQAVKQGQSPKLDVLLLHGAKYSSKDWLDIKTTDNIANWGYRAVAIDLPGLGKSPDAIDKSLYGDFLGAFISTLKMTNVVIVAPSASGRTALPYLFSDPAKSTEKAKGFVPIAPVDTNLYTTQFPQSQLPTLIVYGSKDIQAAIILNNLMLLPKHEILSIEGASHACYLDEPEAFHKVLYHFLKELAS